MNTKTIIAAAFAAIAICSHSVARAAVPEVEWDTTINHFQIDSDKFVGQRLSVRCAPRHVRTESEKVYGSDVYTTDSPICFAALHAGVISSDGGTVTAQVIPGAKAYNGSIRNGVTSESRPETQRAIVFVAGGNKAADAIRSEYQQRLDWDTKFTRTGLANRELVGQQFAFYCPRAPEDMRPRRVVGTDSYAFDSMICRAAVHAGAITTDGGPVIVQMNDREPELVGSIRNGIESSNGSSGVRSLTFVPYSE